MEYARERAMGDAWLVRRGQKGRRVSLKLEGSSGETLVDLECMIGGWEATLPAWAARAGSGFGTPWEAASAAFVAARGIDGAAAAIEEAGHTLAPAIDFAGLSPAVDEYGPRFAAPEVSAAEILSARFEGGRAELACADGSRASLGAATAEALRRAVCDAAVGKGALPLAETRTPERWAAEAAAREEGSPCRAFAASRARLASGILKGRWENMPATVSETDALVLSRPDLECVAVDDGLALPEWVRAACEGSLWGDAMAALAWALRSEGEAMEIARAMAGLASSDGRAANACHAAALIQAAPRCGARRIPPDGPAREALGRELSDEELVGWTACRACGLSDALAERGALGFFDFAKFGRTASPGVRASMGWLVDPASLPRRPEPGDWRGHLEEAWKEEGAPAEPEQLSLFGDDAGKGASDTEEVQAGRVGEAAASAESRGDGPQPKSADGDPPPGILPAKAESEEDAAPGEMDDDAAAACEPEGDGDGDGGPDIGAADSERAEDAADSADSREVADEPPAAASSDKNGGQGGGRARLEPAHPQARAEKEAARSGRPRRAPRGTRPRRQTPSTRPKPVPSRPPQAARPAQGPAARAKAIGASRAEGTLPEPPAPAAPTPSRDKRESAKAIAKARRPR